MHLIQDLQEPGDAYLTVSEVAELLGCHAATVRDVICRGELAAYQPGSRAYRVTTETFFAYLARKGYSAAQRQRLASAVQRLLARSPR